MSEKIKIRIAVAVDAKGSWAASGFGSKKKTQPDKELMSYCLDSIEDGEARYFIEAEIEVPSEPPTVEGDVQPA